MTAKAVAVAADVKTQAGTGVPATADSGTWSPTPVQLTLHSKVTIAGAPVVYEARCTFNFAGVKGNTPVTATEDVVLSATSTKLRSGNAPSDRPVLRDGDQKQSTYGNAVQVGSSRKLASG